MIKHHKLSLCQEKTILPQWNVTFFPLPKIGWKYLGWKTTCTGTANNLLKEVTSALVLTAKVKSLDKTSPALVHCQAVAENGPEVKQKSTGNEPVIITKAFTLARGQCHT